VGSFVQILIFFLVKKIKKKLIGELLLLPRFCISLYPIWEREVVYMYLELYNSSGVKRAHTHPLYNIAQALLGTTNSHPTFTYPSCSFNLLLLPVSISLLTIRERESFIQSKTPTPLSLLCLSLQNNSLSPRNLAHQLDPLCSSSASHCFSFFKNS
jgi:hypothetical protein